MPRAFISYRRDDAASDAARIAQALRVALSKEDVFFDTSSIEAGTQWPNVIRLALAEASTVIVVIGPQWLTAGANEWGCRRIDQENDWVRNEVKVALDDSKKTLIPVLVGNAKMPPASALPACLGNLPDVQKIDIRRDYWEHDIALLIKKVCPASCGYPGAAPEALEMTWDKMTPELQDAFALAASAARREGKKIVSTRLLFAALKRLHTDRIDEVLALIPVDAMPDTIPADITADREALAQMDLVSSCVRSSLGHFDSVAIGSLSGEDIFVDIARHGSGDSVQKLRTHGVNEKRIDEIVVQLGWNVKSRAEQDGGGQRATRPESK